MKTTTKHQMSQSEISKLFPSKLQNGELTREVRAGFFNLSEDGVVIYYEPANNVEEYHGHIDDQSFEDWLSFFSEYEDHPETKLTGKRPPYGTVIRDEKTGKIYPEGYWCPLAEYYTSEKQCQTHREMALSLEAKLKALNLTMEQCWVKDHYEDPTGNNDHEINGWTVFLLQNFRRIAGEVL